MVQYKYHLLTLDELNSESYGGLRNDFLRQLSSYEQEIGGIDLGKGFFMTKGTHYFLAEKEGKLVGWTVGSPPTFGKVFLGEKSFVPTAQYVIPKERATFHYRESITKLVDLLKEKKFDFYHVRPDAPGLVTKKGEKLIQTNFRALKKRGLKPNEGFVGDNIMALDADKIERVLSERHNNRTQVPVHLSRIKQAQKTAWEKFRTLFRRRR